MDIRTRPAVIAAILAAAVVGAACAGSPASKPTAAAETVVAEPDPSPAPPPSAAILETLLKPARGDLEGMQARQVVRVLATFNRTNYSFDVTTQRGAVVDASRAFEQWLRRRLGPDAAALRVAVVPVTRADAIRALADGRGDMVLQVLTAAPEPPPGIVYSAPALGEVREVVVTGPGVPGMVSLEDLAGRTIYVRTGSRHHESLARLNARLAEVGKPGCRIVPVDGLLEDEDLLEMTNAGLIPATVVDNHTVAAWRRIFTALSVNADVAVSQDGALAWAVRADSPKLLALVSEFASTNAAFFSRTLTPKDVAGLAFLKPAAASEGELQLVRAALPSARAAARASRLPYLLLAARAYEDGRTGATDIVASAKDLRAIVDKHFHDPHMDPADQALFAVASTQADPSLVRNLQAQAARMHLDPNVWFGNVELAAARELGRSIVEYVRRVHEYDVGFQAALTGPRGAGGGASQGTAPPGAR